MIVTREAASKPERPLVFGYLLMLEWPADTSIDFRLPA